MKPPSCYFKPKVINFEQTLRKCSVAPHAGLTHATDWPLCFQCKHIPAPVNPSYLPHSRTMCVGGCRTNRCGVGIIGFDDGDCPIIHTHRTNTSPTCLHSQITHMVLGLLVWFKSPGDRFRANEQHEGAPPPLKHTYTDFPRGGIAWCIAGVSTTGKGTAIECSPPA